MLRFGVQTFPDLLADKAADRVRLCFNVTSVHAVAPLKVGSKVNQVPVPVYQ